MSFFAWPEISQFHNLRKYIKSAPELLGGETSKVNYKCKVKLHGTNAAIQICGDGTILAQSRTNIIEPTNDNCGFARWVMSQKDEWVKIRSNTLMDIIVFGEWCGPGVQKGVAVNDIGKKVFAIFAIVLKNGDDLAFISEPDGITSMLNNHNISDVYVLPWYRSSDEIFDFESLIDWESSSEDLQPELAKINVAVDLVEKSDPWVKTNFGVDGIGEGLVFYPISRTNFSDFTNLVFKAKGEKHKIVNNKAPVQADAEVTNSAKEFADLVLTEARFEQGVAAVQSTAYEMKLIGKFLKWIEDDVKKETSAELAACRMEWSQVKNTITSQARQWYLDKNKSL